METQSNSTHRTTQAGQQGHSSAALLALVPAKKATHVAVRDGAWNNPGTWRGRKIPGPGAKVLIPKNRTLTYNRNSAVALDWLRVEGRLKFAHTKDTKLILDTFVVTPTGELEIGTEKNPIRDRNTTQIQFTTQGDFNAKTDPTRLGRGIISHGKVNIVGASKLDHVALAKDALKGDRELVLDLPPNSNRPNGWQIGDKLVLGGTNFKRNGRNGDNSKFQDEVLTITGIQGNRIRFTNDNIRKGDQQVLRFNHTRPNSLRSKLNLYVANITRNVSFETLNAEDVPTQRRAHAMFMQNPDINIKNAGFYELGRTDKTKAIDDIQKNIDGSKGNGTNPRGRYGLHIHKTGAALNDGSVHVEGNAVVGSPGWGIVQHESKGIFKENVVFDVAGAGIVTESGNESGWWINNITIKTTGNGSVAVDPANLKRLKNYDLGYEGEGYWLTGAGQVAMRGNIAISAAGGGINVFSKAFGIEGSRPINTIAKNLLPQRLQEIAPANTRNIPIEQVPLNFFKGFEAYNSIHGILFWQHMGNNDGQLTFNAPNLDPAHNVRTTVKDAKLWGIQDRGIDYQYSTQIDLDNVLIVGGIKQKGNFGIRTNGPSQDLGFKKLQVEGFREGLTVPRAGRFSEDVPFVASTLEKSVFRNNDLNLSERLSYQTPNGEEYYPDYFKIKDTKFFSTGKNQLPVLRQFKYQPIGGLAYQFDASDTFDPDVPGSRQNAKRGIAAYGWDFNADGKVDEFGRIVRHRFPKGGRKEVVLTLWDGQGQVFKARRAVTIRSNPYPNLFMDSRFNKGTKLVGDSKFQGSTGAGFGWLTSGWRVNPNAGKGGALELLNARKGVAQVIYDDKNRIGQQFLSLDILKKDRDNLSAQANVKVWGINGEFEGAGWRTIENGPSKVGTLPFEKTLLLNETATGGNNVFRTFRWEVDLGQRGYDFLVLQINGLNVNHERDEKLLIDNVGFSSPGQPIQSPPSTVNLIAPGSTIARQKVSESRSNYPVAYAASLVASPARLIARPQAPIPLLGTGGSDQLEGGNQHDVLVGQGNTDRLQGGNGNDILVGGRGPDQMSGGNGQDRFRWFRPTHGGDQITDFNPTQDLLEIHGSNFGGGLQSGALNPSQFRLGTRAITPSDRIIYDQSSGQLFFDADGNGGQASVLLARFNQNPNLSSSNIKIL